MRRPWGYPPPKGCNSSQSLISQGVALVEEVLAAVADNNSPPIPRTHLKGFASETEIDDYLLANPETVREQRSTF